MSLNLFKRIEGSSFVYLATGVEKIVKLLLFSVHVEMQCNLVACVVLLFYYILNVIVADE